MAKTKTVDSPITILDRQITGALAELRGARAEYDHCPSTDNELTVEYAELRLDKLIVRRQTETTKLAY